MRLRVFLVVFLLGLPACRAHGRQAANDTFAIYVSEPSVEQPSGDLSRLRLVGTPVITGADVLAYNWDTHDMAVTTNAILRLPRFSAGTFSNFVVVVRGKRCYAGSFWPLDISARPMPRDVPLILVPTDRNRALANPVLNIGVNLRHVSGKLVSVPVAGRDVRADPRVRDELSRLGKLKAAKTLGPNKPVQATAG
jgi:hypothetical protein